MVKGGFNVYKSKKQLRSEILNILTNWTDYFCTIKMANVDKRLKKLSKRKLEEIKQKLLKKYLTN